MTAVHSLLPWHQSAWRHLSLYIDQQRLPQALLIYGQKGLGKQQLAEQLAYALLCQARRPDYRHCGQCDSCLLLNAESHPDFLLIKPEEVGKAITIAQIRQLLSSLTLKPHYDGFRVVMLNPAEQLNSAAANAFLKGLEEPPERTIFILLSEKVEQLPATIRSRCQKLALAKPDRETHHAWLKQQHRLSENLDLLYSLSQGAPLVSLSYANENLLAQRQQCFKDWLALAKQQSHPAIIAENWQKVPEASLLFWLTTWLADLIKCGYRAPLEKLANPDFCSYLQELSQQLELNQIFSLYDALLNSRQKLNTTLNKLLMLEEILIQWRQLNQR